MPTTNPLEMAAALEEKIAAMNPQERAEFEAERAKIAARAKAAAGRKAVLDQIGDAKKKYPLTVKSLEDTDPVTETRLPAMVELSRLLTQFSAAMDEELAVQNRRVQLQRQIEQQMIGTEAWLKGNQDEDKKDT